MIRNSITLDEAIDLLNDMVAMDREAMHALMETRVPCDDMHHHPEVQTVENEGYHYVGPIGVLNGLFGTLPAGPKEGWGPIAAVYDAEGMLSEFRRTDDSTVVPKIPGEATVAADQPADD